MKNFNSLVKSITNIEIIVPSDAPITDICYNSQKATPGSLFVALNGTNTDGSRYIQDAISNGAVAIISDKIPDNIPDNIGFARSKNTHDALAQLSSIFYDNPSSKLKLIGITATSGKTTVSHIVHSIFKNADYKTGLIGTINIKIGDEIINSTHTTPESRDLQEIFKKMIDVNTDVCVMEVSSHSLDQGRVAASEFDVAAFLNIARDHLDYHKTAEAYKNAKLKLFTKFSNPNTIAVVNIDDPFAIDIISSYKGKVITFSATRKADVYATDCIANTNHVDFTLNIADIKIPITFHMGGIFNINNALAAAAICYACNISLPKIKRGIELCESVSGRFQSVKTNKDFSVIIDYAHTPDELEKVIDSAKNITDGRILLVFGCGGNRDKGKRSIMGRIGVSNSDYTIITSDNPRFENPTDIINDIIEGIPEDSKNKFKIETDRKKAIKEIIKLAQPKDVIVIAGKGHETYQEINGEKYEFNDSQIAKDILETL